MDLMRRSFTLLTITICFRSVHAAVLQPHRLARWLGCYRPRPGCHAKLLPEEHYACVAQLASQLVQRKRPPADEPPWCAAGEVPSKVTVEEWRKGAVQLQQEVGDCEGLRVCV
jgi:hypothetical protein